MADDTSTKLVIVDPSGDVLLIVGPQKQEVQVSSKGLSLGSKVFQAMFSQHYNEGTELRASEQLYRLPLPDDEPQNMITLCKVLHVNHEGLDLSADIEKLKAFAIIADKYGCFAASSFFLTVWKSKFAAPTTLDHGGLMMLAYLSNDALAFRYHSQRLLSRWNGGFQHCQTVIDATETLPKEIFALLGTRRSELEQRLALVLMNPITRLLPCNSTISPRKSSEHSEMGAACMCGASKIYAHLRNLNLLKLWPVEPSGWDLDECLKSLSEFPERDVKGELGLRKDLSP
ncbi:hypothetical protein EJ08DRAFT_632495, partial [Tothia fuscella]